MSRVLHDGRDDGLEPLESLDLERTSGFADLLQRMSKTAFGGRELGEAFQVLRTMVDDSDCTRVLTISGAMSVAKMGLVICQMIDAGLVDIIVSTGAIMAHGLSEAIGCVHYKHDPKVSDKQLFDWGYNRVYDTLEMESNLWQAQQVVGKVLDEIDWSQPTCSWRLNREIGRKLFEQGQMPSILGTAYHKGVPVFVPAFTDSELGLDVATHFLAKKYSGDKKQCLDELCESVPPYNPFLDLYDYAQRIQRAKRLGIFTISGGASRGTSAPASRAVSRHHQYAARQRLARAALPLRRADLPGAGPLGRPERLYLHRRRLLGQVPQPRGRRAIR